MTAVLSPGLRTALESVKSSTKANDEPGTRERMGVLKRMGLVELERTDKGEKWTVTEKGKVALKDTYDAASAPDAPADVLTAGA